jgi:divinyl chlorophyllide a 8-vinyl-reductase
MLDCATESDKWNKILNIGGPGEGLTMRQQGELLFQVSQSSV